MKTKKINSERKVVKSPIKIFNYKKFNEGTIYQSANGDYFIILEYINSENVKIKFLDWYGYEKVVYKNQIIKGWVWNPYRILYNGGFIGEGKFCAKYNKKIYTVWDGILNRAYTRNGKDAIHYLDSFVCEEWRCLQNFGNWYENYIININPKYHSNIQVDKDIKQWNYKYKIYSPDTCCLVPPEINILLNRLNVDRKYNLPVGVKQVSKNSYISRITLGHRNQFMQFGPYKTPEEAFEVYKNEKQKRIANLATMYYNDGAILEDVYKLLLNIEILPY